MPRVRLALLPVLVGSGCAERDGRRIRASQSVFFALSARAMLLPPVKTGHAERLHRSALVAPLEHADST